MPAIAGKSSRSIVAKLSDTTKPTVCNVKMTVPKAAVKESILHVHAAHGLAVESSMYLMHGDHRFGAGAEAPHMILWMLFRAPLHRAR
jgi:hypothetical protein